jgi:hypothetical protein
MGGLGDVKGTCGGWTSSPPLRRGPLSREERGRTWGEMAVIVKFGGVRRPPGHEVSGLRDAPDQSGFGAARRSVVIVAPLLGRCGKGTDMTVRITINVPVELARELAQVQDRLVEVLERGLREVLAESGSGGQDEQQIMAVLAGQPSPEEVLALRPSTSMQERVSRLLDRSNEGGLSAEEAAELERYLMLEHLVRLAKGHACRRHQDNANRGSVARWWVPRGLKSWAESPASGYPAATRREARLRGLGTQPLCG